MTLESVIASIIIVAFLVSVSRIYLIEVEPPDASATAYDILKELDDQGVLRVYAAAMDYAGLDAQVDIAGYDHIVNICDSGRSCVGPEPNGTDIWTGSYFIAGQSVYQPIDIKLYLWKVGG